MLLSLSSLPPWDTTFRNAEGQTIYKTEYESHIGAPRQITMKRILPSQAIDVAKGSEDALQDSFSDLAEIKYNRFSSHIRYNGSEMDTTQFLKNSGFLGRHRAFTGPDGKEYEWMLRLTECKLYLKDAPAPRPLVASYLPRTLGIIGDARPASFEILPEGEHMVDLIFVTFIFVEKLRLQRQKHPVQRLVETASYP